MQGLQGALLDFSLIALPSMVIGVFLGPAFSRVARAEAFGIPLEEIRAEADAVAGRGEAPTRTRKTAANKDESDNLVLWVGGVLIVVTLYLTYRVQILIALLLLAGSISVVAWWSCWWRLDAASSPGRTAGRWHSWCRYSSAPWVW